MSEIINWCNNNDGFIMAILAFLSLLLSAVAIIVSIKTARMPYKKGLKLGSSYNILFSQDLITSKVNSQMAGMSITAVNIGARDVNISFLGLAVKDKSFGKNKRILSGINADIGGKGIVHPTELNKANYNAIDLISALDKIPNAKVYMYATDSEGKSYCHFIGKAKSIVRNLSM